MDDDIIDVNCGRCGRPLRVRLDDLLDKRSVDCLPCAQLHDRREEATRSGSSGTRDVLRVPVAHARCSAIGP
jgi:hypothetical protein